MGSTTDIIPYGGGLGGLSRVGELKPHITYNQYLELRKQPEILWSEKKLENKREGFLKVRDRLLLDFCWETGGRIGDICRVKKTDFDFKERTLKLAVKKTKQTITLTLSKDLCYDMLDFYTTFNKEPFFMTTSNAWKMVKKYGAMIGINLHPHMFRHGLAIHLLYSGVPIPVISYRLGHSNTRTTMDFYMKITPELEREFLKRIDWRGDNRGTPN